MPYKNSEGKWIYRYGERVPDWVRRRDVDSEFKPAASYAGFRRPDSRQRVDRRFTRVIELNQEIRWLRNALTRVGTSIARKRINDAIRRRTEVRDRIERAIAQQKQFRDKMFAPFGGQFSAVPPS